MTDMATMELPATELPKEYRLELSDEFNSYALAVTQALKAMTLTELNKLRARLEKQPNIGTSPKADAMLVVLAAIGMNYVGALEAVRLQHKSDVAAEGG